MKKIFLVMLCAVAAFAGVESPFVQFAPTDFCNDPHITRGDQNWQGAQLITLQVKGGTDVWLSNYIRSWYEPVADLHGNVYDMLNGQKYGYIFKDSISGFDASKEDYADKIIWGTGATTDITYYYDDNPSITATATGYFLDSFENDAEIYLVMTTLAGDGHELVDSYQHVQDAGYDTTLVSRLHNTTDQAGNVRINFGIDSVSEGWIGREFVAVYNSTASGQPLPGVLSSILIVGSLMGGYKTMKRKKD